LNQLITQINLNDTYFLLVFNISLWDIDLENKFGKKLKFSIKHWYSCSAQESGLS